jgi:hypothetical protein
MSERVPGENRDHLRSGADARRDHRQRAGDGAAGEEDGLGLGSGLCPLFLHSDEAKFITGVSLPVDGGASVS